MSTSSKTPELVVTSQAAIANFCGVATSTVKVWVSQGMPTRKGGYELGAVVRWLRSDGPWQQFGRGEATDPLLVGDVDSPGLERYRLAKAAHAELDLQERQNSLIARDKVRVVLGRWASILRQCGERLQKRYGAEAVVTLNDALTECEGIVDEFGSAV